MYQFCYNLKFITGDILFHSTGFLYCWFRRKTTVTVVASAYLGEKNNLWFGNRVQYVGKIAVEDLHVIAGWHRDLKTNIKVNGIVSNQ